MENRCGISELIKIGTKVKVKGYVIVRTHVAGYGGANATCGVVTGNPNILDCLGRISARPGLTVILVAVCTCNELSSDGGVISIRSE